MRLLREWDLASPYQQSSQYIFPTSCVLYVCIVCAVLLGPVFFFMNPCSSSVSPPTLPNISNFKTLRFNIHIITRYSTHLYPLIRSIHKMPGNWSREEEADLLRALCAVKTISVTGKEWDAIASEMSTNHTGDACRYGTLTIKLAFLLLSFSVSLLSLYTPYLFGADPFQAAFREDSERVRRHYWLSQNSDNCRCS